MRLLILLMAAWSAACSHDVRVRYPSRGDEPTGTLVLALTQAAQGVTVAVNGELLVEDAHTQRVQIDGVPVGTAEIIVAANGGDKAFHAWVGSERPTTVPLGIPDEGPGFLKTLAGSLATVVLYSLLR